MGHKDIEQHCEDLSKHKPDHAVLNAMAKARLSILAVSAGRSDAICSLESSHSSYGHIWRPLGGVPYEIEIILDGAKKVVLTGQMVNEGETRLLTLKEAEFK